MIKLVRTLLLPAGLAAALIVQAPSAVAAGPGDELAKLPASAAGVVATGGSYLDGKPGFLGGKYVLMYRDSNVVLSGKGYFQIRYEIAYFNRPGQMVMPTFEAKKGSAFRHVASAGGRRMDDRKPGAPKGHTWMGNPEEGYITLPKGAEQMWQNEFYYLDGTVTLTNHEKGADYNISADPKTHDQIADELDRPVAADGKDGWVRQGIVRSEGRDARAAETSAPTSGAAAGAAEETSDPNKAEKAEKAGKADKATPGTDDAAPGPSEAASDSRKPADTAPQGGSEDLAATGSNNALPYYAAAGAAAVILGGTLAARRRKRG